MNTATLGLVKSIGCCMNLDGQKKILIVDDEPDVLIYLETLLEDNGFSTLTANNGTTALEIAEKERPDLITLDITMPEQSGIKTYRYIKSNHNLRPIPVVIITAMGESIKHVLNRLSGFPEPEGFMSKPIVQDELVEMISNLVIG